MSCIEKVVKLCYITYKRMTIVDSRQNRKEIKVMGKAQTNEKHPKAFMPVVSHLCLNAWHFTEQSQSCFYS